MTYPILTSPSHAPEVIIEFTSKTVGRIVLAHPKAYHTNYAGSMSPVGYHSNRWYRCTVETFGASGAAWAPPDPSLYHLCPYIQDKYPELLL